jgi:hypothetical protein
MAEAEFQNAWLFDAAATRRAWAPITPIARSPIFWCGGLCAAPPTPAEEGNLAARSTLDDYNE